jgi:hypothetical protein
VRQGLKVTYTIRRVPTPHGPQFRVALTIDNTLDWVFGGLIFGGFDLTGVPRNRNNSQPYGWGGSSLDTLQPEPLTRRTTRVWAGGTPEGVVVPSDTQIVDLDLNTYLSVPRRPHDIYSKWVDHCAMPARVRAPRRLVAGHPTGHWTEPAPRND